MNRNLFWWAWQVFCALIIATTLSVFLFFATAVLS